jgi:hypothetical protein
MAVRGSEGLGRLCVAVGGRAAVPAVLECVQQLAQQAGANPQDFR